MQHPSEEPHGQPSPSKPMRPLKTFQFRFFKNPPPQPSTIAQNQSAEIEEIQALEQQKLKERLRSEIEGIKDRGKNHQESASLRSEQKWIRRLLIGVAILLMIGVLGTVILTGLKVLEISDNVLMVLCGTSLGAAIMMCVKVSSLNSNKDNHKDLK